MSMRLQVRAVEMTWRPRPLPSLAPSMIPGRSNIWILAPVLEGGRERRREGEGGECVKGGDRQSKKGKQRLRTGSVSGKKLLSKTQSSACELTPVAHNAWHTGQGGELV